MKQIKDILEASVLSDIETNVKSGDKYIKHRKEIEDNKKLLYLLDDLWNNLDAKRNWTMDRFGTSIEIGDVVLFHMDPINRDEMCYGIVIEILENVPGKVWYDKYRILASSAWNEDPIEGDPYNDCTTYRVGDEDVVAVLARKKNAKKMLELLVKIL
jgi:hypothetical protein